MRAIELYQKVSHGKRVRYEKYCEQYGDDLNRLPVGAHLIVVHGDGCQSYCCNIDPDRAAVLAAIGELRHEMEEAMRKRNQWEPAPAGKPYTKAEKKLVDELLALRKGGPVMLKGCTIYDIIRAGIKVLEDKLHGH